MTQPNVIIILTDDQGYGDVGCHGNPWLRTPHLDALQAESVRLTDFHVDPMCAPTRAGLMTGRYSARTGVWSTLTGRYIMSPDETTIGDVFRTSGYATGLFGKWHLGDSWPYRPHDRGFQETLSFGGGVVGEIPDYWDNDYFSATYLRNGVPERFDDRYCTDVWFDEAIAFIDRHRDGPFFCYIPTNAPHSPFNVYGSYSDPYVAMGVPEERARFYGMITCIDENIGRLRDHLSAAGLRDNTILVFMGDNGTACGCGLDRDGFVTNGYNAGLRGKKCWAFEGGHRNSCFIHWPAGDLTDGRDVDCLSAQIDLLPTLAELCGLRRPDVRLDGRSIATILRGERQDHEEERVLCVHNQQRDTPVKYKDFQVMTSDWRLAQTAQWGGKSRQLFDIRHDPGQARDLSAEHPETVERLMAEYEGWWASISERFGDISPIYIGGEQNPVKITCHAWHGKEGLYNQWHVRPGLVDNGYWPLEVVTADEYELRLSRWPEEADTPIRSAIPPRSGVPFVDDFVPGEALSIVEARISVGGTVQCCPVHETDAAVSFRVQLPVGRTRLETVFTDEEGVVRGAYYVYVSRIGS
ncbi:MAG: arylsulfatase [Lentisphaerae bacterium]|jgi:arylsulfatase A-like enzyme|nr:arylsulfatase [Lentisphaerota bacterium]MBT4816921.1 arylsulfatase [Lentisphaerota bacterium]MBT5609385.1 arylsulfatase [Lentisphaerota bacterium]MBT7060797.1 arylsulfatase [Lentisphaerota bacterium]MBT7843488.1 arylsulfatase [Lentisphaerota bacterium]